MSPRGACPKISVIIPTYNRHDLLRETLLQLTRQTLPASDFEVIVSDDGSSDATFATANSFSGQLLVKYHFQEDLGFRAAAARNAGARMAAAPVLVFLDTGAMVGPEFLEYHLAEHQGSAHRAVIGYAFGYNPEKPMRDVGDFLGRLAPERIVENFRDNPAFFDIRHGEFAKCAFDLSRRAIPWSLLFTINCSFSAEDFWAIGGFDESFCGWGAEDLEFGFRLFRHGLTFSLSRDAWVVESSHERDMVAAGREFMKNMGYFLTKYPEPVIEMGWTAIKKFQLWYWEDYYSEFISWRDTVGDLEAADEIDQAVRRIPGGDRIAVVGAGAAVPETLPPAYLMDFDRTLLDRALADGRHSGHHAIGLRTPLADQSVDTVIITSRLAGLWDRWQDDLLAEAYRIGSRVCVFTAARVPAQESA